MDKPLFTLQARSPQLFSKAQQDVKYAVAWHHKGATVVVIVSGGVMWCGVIRSITFEVRGTTYSLVLFSVSSFAPDLRLTRIAKAPTRTPHRALMGADCGQTLRLNLVLSMNYLRTYVRGFVRSVPHF